MLEFEFRLFSMGMGLEFRASECGLEYDAPRTTEPISIWLRD